MHNITIWSHCHMVSAMQVNPCHFHVILPLIQQIQVSLISYSIITRLSPRIKFFNFYHISNVIHEWSLPNDVFSLLHLCSLETMLVFMPFVCLSCIDYIDKHIAAFIECEFLNNWNCLYSLLHWVTILQCWEAAPKMFPSYPLPETYTP